jgi:hypothetical protein
MGFIKTIFITIASILIYKLSRYTAAYVAYGSEKNKRLRKDSEL